MGVAVGITGVGVGVAVGITGVAVGGTGVAEGGTGVAEGGTGVAEGGTGVAVGGTGVGADLAMDGAGLLSAVCFGAGALSPPPHETRPSKATTDVANINARQRLIVIDNSQYLILTTYCTYYCSRLDMVFYGDFAVYIGDV